MQPGGVGHNPQGFAYASAPNPLANLTAFAAFSKLGKGFGSNSYSSSSPKVSIVKYDDHFKEKGWCEKNLVKPGKEQFSAEEIKKNPPLALKFGDCDFVVPIPSHEAMCKTTEELLKVRMGSSYKISSSEEKKNAANAISKELLLNFVEECGYGKDALPDECRGFAKNVPAQLPTSSPSNPNLNLQS